jgi:hypothetical protein
VQPEQRIASVHSDLINNGVFVMNNQPTRKMKSHMVLIIAPPTQWGEYVFSARLVCAGVLPLKPRNVRRLAA